MRGGERARALRDLCGPRRATRGRTRAARAAAAAARRDRQGRQAQGRPAQLCPLRLGPLLGADSASSARRSSCRVHDGRIEIIHLGELVATHLVVAPGEVSIDDDHYGGPRPAPRRAVRPKTASEKAFCELGPVAESFIKGAAASGMTALKGDLDELLSLHAAHGTEASRGRTRTGDRLRAVPRPRRAVDPRGRQRRRPTEPTQVMRSSSRCRSSPTRSLSDYAIGATVVSHAAPQLAADLEAGLRRLRLSAMRQLAARAARRRPRPSAGSQRSSSARCSRPRSPRATPPTPGPA